MLLNTRVTRILPVDGSDSRNYDNGPSFRKVEFAISAQGQPPIYARSLVMAHTKRSAPRLTLTATKEVIVSGGAINSPQILLNSGIGSKNALEKLGIDVVVDNPSVGQNFTDQLSVGISFATNLPLTDK